MCSSEKTVATEEGVNKNFCRDCKKSEGRLHFYLRYPMDQPRFPERILLRLKTELTRICINIKKERKNRKRLS